jgi:GTP-binding protein Era
MKKSGSIIIVGYPNVGKSTLFNRLIGEKTSITSSKKYTTQESYSKTIIIKQSAFIFIDTPGALYKEKDLIGYNVILFVVAANVWNNEQKQLALLLSKINTPIILVINKVDKLVSDLILDEFIKPIIDLFTYVDLFYISAKHGHGLQPLMKKIHSLLPSVDILPIPIQEDRIWRMKEIVREKLMRFLNQELPYQFHIELDEEVNLIYITILVYKNNHKKIIIGSEGQKIKLIREETEIDFQKLLQINKRLHFFVKTKTK